MQSSSIEIVKFQKAKIVCPMINGEPHVLAKSIIDAIGFNYQIKFSIQIIITMTKLEQAIRFFIVRRIQKRDTRRAKRIKGVFWYNPLN
jgi:hypothetical protein